MDVSFDLFCVKGALWNSNLCPVEGRIATSLGSFDRVNFNFSVSHVKNGDKKKYAHMP